MFKYLNYERVNKISSKRIAARFITLRYKAVKYLFSLLKAENVNLEGRKPYNTKEVEA